MRKEQLEYLAAALITAAEYHNEKLKAFFGKGPDDIEQSEVRSEQSLRDRLRYSVSIVGSALQSLQPSAENIAASWAAKTDFDENIDRERAWQDQAVYARGYMDAKTDMDAKADIVAAVAGDKKEKEAAILAEWYKPPNIAEEAYDDARAHAAMRGKRLHTEYDQGFKDGADSALKHATGGLKDKPLRIDAKQSEIYEKGRRDGAAEVEARLAGDVAGSLSGSLRSDQPNLQTQAKAARQEARKLWAQDDRPLFGTPEALAVLRKGAGCDPVTGEPVVSFEPDTSLWWKDGRRTHYNPCCSSVEPCSYQQRFGPTAVCDNCKAVQAAKQEKPAADMSKLDQLEAEIIKSAKAAGEKIADQLFGGSGNPDGLHRLAEPVGKGEPAKMLVTDHEQVYRELRDKMTRGDAQFKVTYDKIKSQYDQVVLANDQMQLELDKVRQLWADTDVKLAKMKGKRDKWRQRYNDKGQTVVDQADEFHALSARHAFVVNKLDSSARRVTELEAEVEHFQNNIGALLKERAELTKRCEELKLHETAARLAENHMAATLEKLQEEHKILNGNYGKVYKVGYDDGQANRRAMPNTAPVHIDTQPAPTPENADLSLRSRQGGMIIDSDSYEDGHIDLTDEAVPSEMYTVNIIDDVRAAGKLWRGDRARIGWATNFVEVSPALWHALARIPQSERRERVLWIAEGPAENKRVWGSTATDHHPSVDFTTKDIYAVNGIATANKPVGEVVPPLPGLSYWYNPETHQLHSHGSELGRGSLGSNWVEIQADQYQKLGLMTLKQRYNFWMDLNRLEPPLQW